MNLWSLIPGAKPIDGVAACRTHEAVGVEVHIGRVDVQVRRRLPFNLQIGVSTNVAPGIGVAPQQRHARRLVEAVLGVFPPLEGYSRENCKVGARLELNVGIGIDGVYRRLDVRFGKVVVLGK